MKLEACAAYERTSEKNEFVSVTVTPGHRFLAADGSFRAIGDILDDDSRIVLADGSIIAVTAERFVYSSQSAGLYEEAQVLTYPVVGATVRAPLVKSGWKTYNFEVEELHTYVAGGVRVHNDSKSTLAVAATEFTDLFKRPFTGSQED